MCSGITHGLPIDRVWPAWYALGATVTGLLSIPSYGPPVALVPLFLTAATLIWFGTWRIHRRITSVGLGLMYVASWARAWALWGISQGGAGSKVLASTVWLWIASGCLLGMVAVSKRGIR